MSSARRPVEAPPRGSGALAHPSSAPPLGRRRWLGAVSGWVGAASLATGLGSAATVRAALAYGLASSVVSRPSRARAEVSTFALRVFVDGPRQPDDEAWLARQVATANVVFAPTDVAFRVGEVVVRDVARGPVTTREERDALATDVSMLATNEPASIHLFVTSRLVDVDDPPTERRGVHWRARTDRRVHYLVVSTIAGDSVLAHELGHYFGNPHSARVNDIMSYERDGTAPPTFDARERRRVRALARRYRAAGVR